LGFDRVKSEIRRRNMDYKYEVLKEPEEIITKEYKDPFEIDNNNDHRNNTIAIIILCLIYVSIIGYACYNEFIVGISDCLRCDIIEVLK